MVKVFRNPSESAERLISKFNKAFQASRKGLVASAKKYRQKDLNKRKQRIRAIKREENRAKREKMSFNI
jgi:hypothetical protein